jgi:hypothetical protein
VWNTGKFQCYLGVIHEVFFSALTHCYTYHCGWAPLRPSDSDFGQNWKPGTKEILLLYSNGHKGSFRCVNHRQSTHHLTFDKPASTPHEH